ncbi:MULTISPECIES: hypothetical protein [unclassified Methanobrevibacter]|uniref:hypothetical protein n=1 Tax=unclassified Methanobrevibacter TaxID=2638681 RepID=UPI002734B8D9|nr:MULTISPECIES: hypothetical protein [unclassified Methanobrevibacter]
MIHPKYMNKIVEHKSALLFVGGIATAIIGKKIIESKTVKDATTQAVAGVMSAKQDAEKAVEDMKKEAEEIAEE